MDLRRVGIRILVTGTRGKSSLVRLLHAGLSAVGLRTHSRVTGVLPRELSPAGQRVIRRTSPVSFREMRWWLSQVPRDAEALVLENSAVSPLLQPAAGRWLDPTLLVWTTLRPDHQDAWGPGVRGAAEALLRGVPRGVPVLAGPEAALVARALEARGPATLMDLPPSFREGNILLAMRALTLSLEGTGLASSEALAAARRAMESLPPDVADFRILGEGEDLLAVAFSANETASTEQLFVETGWRAEETTLLFHHRPDRPARLRAFLPWIRSLPWRATAFTRTSRPWLRLDRLRWTDEISDPASFAAWRRGRGRVFACGNVAGWPLEFLLSAERSLEEAS